MKTKDRHRRLILTMIENMNDQGIDSLYLLNQISEIDKQKN
jgi:hypothetical protein